jgi:hypothetical protein
MTNLPRPTEIGQTVALDWLRFSLGQGEIISPMALKFISEREGHAYTLAPDTVDQVRLATPHWGGVIEAGVGSPRKALGRVLKTLAARGAASVVVEDEIREKRDPKPSADGLLRTAFVGEKVIHWAELAEGVDDAVIVVDRGSGGYPTNAFVTSLSAEELGLVDGADIDHDIAGPAVNSLVAVIVAAYDDETFLIWEPRDTTDT